MNKMIKFVSLLIFATFSLNTFADDNESTPDDAGFFVGTSLGVTNSDVDENSFSEELAQFGMSATLSNTDENDIGFKVYAGYDFNQYFGVEAGYVNLGDISADVNITAPFVATADVNVKGDGFMFASVVSYPLFDKTKVFGKLGAFRWENEAKATLLGQTGTADDDGTDLMFGLGANYKIADDITIRAEWERYALDDFDVDLFSAGVQFYF